MQLFDFRKGLEILSQHFDNPSGFHIGAEHDAFYVYPTDRQMNPENILKMIELGWFQEHDERDYNNSFSLKDYRPTESWCAYL